jgi:dTDP-4-dehydrorhamnose reductase
VRTYVVTGATGLFGPYLLEAAARRGKAIGWSRHTAPAVDLLDDDSVARAAAEALPDVVIHAAALTDVDRCEREPALADQANRQATRNLVRHLPPTTRLMYVSTDQVYPNQPGPHREGSEAPVNTYGATKLAGEHEALAHRNSLALRLNLFGQSRTTGRKSLSDFFVESLAGRKPTTLFRDSFFSPLHMATLAELILDLAATRANGTYNVGSRAGMSKRDFALAIAAHLALPTESAVDADSQDMPNRAPRPRDLRLDVTAVESVLGRSMPTLMQEVARL